MTSTHVDHGGLYKVERHEDGCAIETRICSSLTEWSVLVLSGTGALAAGIISLAWVIPKLPVEGGILALILLVPVVRYWWRLPLRFLPGLFLFGRTLILDRKRSTMRLDKTWVPGITSTEAWRYSDVVEVGLSAQKTGVAVTLCDGSSLALDATHFEPRATICAIRDYMPDKLTSELASLVVPASSDFTAATASMGQRRVRKRPGEGTSVSSIDGQPSSGHGSDGA